MLDIKLKLKPGHTNARKWMEPSPLKTLFWNITYECNYGCGICFTDAGANSPNELTTQEALETVEKIHAAGVHDLILSGGEPFMREDMLDILSHMAKFGIAARIASNGSLLMPELLKRLRGETLTKSFQISLDSVESNFYAQFHSSSSSMFNSVLKNLRDMQKYGFHTTVSVRVTPHTLPGIPRLIDLAFQEGWSTVTLHLPVHTKRINNAFPQDDDLISHLEPVFEHFSKLPLLWLVETYIPWAEYHPVIRRLQKKLRFVHRGCRAGRDRLTINPTGSLSPCVCIDVSEAYVGNVRQDDLQDVFQNSPFCKLLRDPQKHEICKGCPNLLKCGSGCRAAAFALTGRLDADDMSCPVWKRRNRKESKRP
jgi:radical SAM protein with 4Fe4S-binding SPASM domain